MKNKFAVAFAVLSVSAWAVSPATGQVKALTVAPAAPAAFSRAPAAFSHATGGVAAVPALTLGPGALSRPLAGLAEAGRITAAASASALQSASAFQPASVSPAAANAAALRRIAAISAGIKEETERLGDIGRARPGDVRLLGENLERLASGGAVLTAAGADAIQVKTGVEDAEIQALLLKARREIYPGVGNDAILDFVYERTGALTLDQARRLFAALVIEDSQIDRTSAMQSYNSGVESFLIARYHRMSWKELKSFLDDLKPVSPLSSGSPRPIKFRMVKKYLSGPAVIDASEAAAIAAYIDDNGERNAALQNYFDARRDSISWSGLKTLLAALRRPSFFSGREPREKTQDTMVEFYYERELLSLDVPRMEEIAGLMSTWEQANYMIDHYVEKRVAGLSRDDIRRLAGSLRRGSHVLSGSGYTRKTTAERLWRRFERVSEK